MGWGRSGRDVLRLRLLREGRIDTDEPIGVVEGRDDGWHNEPNGDPDANRHANPDTNVGDTNAKRHANTNPDVRDTVTNSDVRVTDTNVDTDG